MNEYLTTEQAAERLSISPKTLRKWHTERKQGRPVQHKFGASVRYSIVDLMAWESTCRQESAA
jgi:predicted site-specific integrase-resolvase